MFRRRRRAIIVLSVLAFSGSGAAAGGNTTAPGKTPPVNLTPPAISGTAKTGNTVSTNGGQWSGPTPSLAYTWERCNSAGGSCSATSVVTSTYTLAAADVGCALRVLVIATNKNGSTAAVSNAVGVVSQSSPNSPNSTSTTSSAQSTTTSATSSTTPTTTSTTSSTTTTTSASNPYLGKIGYNIPRLEFDTASTVDTEVARIRPLGWVRADFAWEAIEHTQGTFDWTYTDTLVRAAAENGLNVLPIIDYSALWASSAPSTASDRQFYPPANDSDYANYAVHIVNRYGAGGGFWAENPSVPYRPITAVELWNEPYQWGFWRTGSDPSASRYAQLVRDTAPAIHQAHPEIAVLMSGQMWRHTTSGDISGWLQNILAYDPAIDTIVDGYAVHPYANGGPYCDSCPGHQFIQAKATHDYDPTLPVWITEVGWTSAYNCTTYGANATTEANQATYEHDAAVRALTDWGSFIKVIIFHSFDASTGDTSNCEDGYGLRRASDDSLKPAAVALAQLVATGN